MERTKRSRSGSRGLAGSTCITRKYRVVMMSMAEREPPICPEAARCTMSMPSTRALAAVTARL